MKTVGFKVRVAPGESLRVVLQWGETGDEDRAWRAAGKARFEAAYAPEDSVRPAVVIPDTGDEDLAAAQVTSRPRTSRRVFAV